MGMSIARGVSQAKMCVEQAHVKSRAHWVAIVAVLVVTIVQPDILRV